MLPFLIPLLVLGGLAMSRKPSSGALEGGDDAVPESPGSGKITNEGMREIQSRLQAIGFYSGEIHGVFSTETAESIADFQEFANFPVTGLPDRDTLLEIWAAYDNLQGQDDPSVDTTLDHDFAYPYSWPYGTFVDASNTVRDGAWVPSNMILKTPKAGSEGDDRINVEWKPNNLSQYDKARRVRIVVVGNGYWDGGYGVDRPWINRYWSIVNSIKLLAGQFPDTLFVVNWFDDDAALTIRVNWLEAEEWGGFFGREEIEDEFAFDIPNNVLVEEIADTLYEIE